MLEGAATARLREKSTAIIPGSTTIINSFIIMPPYCSARSQYPSSRDIAIAVPLCNYPVWLKSTRFHELGAIRCQGWSSDCPGVSDRFVRSVHESPRRQDGADHSAKRLQQTICGELDLLPCGRNNAARSV